MSDDASPVLSLPFILPAQAQKHVTHNEALRLLDVLVQSAVTSRSTPAPPDFPAQGARWIVPSGGTGAFAGQDHAIALHDQGGWVFVPPQPGWRAQVLDEGRAVVFDGSQWRSPAEQAQRFARVGVATDADAVNRLAVAAPGSLFSHDGAGHRLTVNKAASADTASLLFQTGWSGRAEMGLAGEESFTLKVSPNGSTWTTALRAQGSGQLGAPAGLDAAALTLAGSPVYARSTLLGAVGQSGGVPTGGVIERGSNANGDYVRLADGTQICTRLVDLDGTSLTSAMGALYRSDANLGPYAFPASFVGTPHHVGATLHKSDNNILRQNGVAVRLRRGQTTASLAWEGIVLVSAASVTGTAGEITRLSLFAIGRWF